MTEAVQWAPSGDALDGIPSEVVALLGEDGKTFGYGYGHGWLKIFGSAHGDIAVQPGQWVIRNDDGSIIVRDAPPSLSTPPEEGAA